MLVDPSPKFQLQPETLDEVLVNCMQEPSQAMGSLALNDTTGVGCTVTCTVAVMEGEQLSEAVTVYVVFAVGETVITLPVWLPGIQV